MRLMSRSTQSFKRVLTALAKIRNRSVAQLPPSTWNMDVAADGRLRLDGTDLPSLLHKWGSPLHVIDAAALRRNAAAFLAAATEEQGTQERQEQQERQDKQEGSIFEVYYSYKTNPIPAVLSLLHGNGIGAEVISAHELWLALKLGVPPDRIIYNGPVKSAASVREAVRRDIALINVNHQEELAGLAEAAVANHCRPRVGVRVSTLSTWSGQFGASIGNGEALATLREALAIPSLDVCALHMHPGLPMRDAATYERALHELMDFVALAHRSLGFTPRVLDIGGSLTTPSVAPIGALARKLNMALLADLTPPSPADALDIAGCLTSIRRVIRKRCNALGMPMPRVMLEPGRAMTGNTQHLLATVHSVKLAKQGPNFAILDAGINLAQIMQSEFHQIYAASRMLEPRSTSWRIVGPICSPGDVLSWACTLPALAPGDCVAICDAGAYFVPFATSFSYPQPAIVMLDGHDIRLVRRAETSEDLVALDVPQWPAPVKRIA